MRHQLRPSIDSLETKTLLSQFPVGIIGPQLPIGAPAAVETPVTPVIGRPVGPVVVSPTPPPAIPIPALATSITTNQTSYTPGQVVEMTFKMTNDTNQTVVVPIGPSIDGFSVTLGGKTIWQSNSGPQPDIIVLDELPTGQSITLTASWVAHISGTFVVHNQLDPTDTASFAIASSPVISPFPTRQG